MDPKRVNIRDIATASGFSTSTVSRALTGKSRISEKTINQIKEVATKLGYSPDPYLSALALYRTRSRKASFRSVIQFVYSEKFPLAAPDVSSHVAECLHGAQEICTELGYKIEVLKMPASRDEQHQILNRLLSRGIQGLIFIHSHFSDEELNGWLWSKFAAINVSGDENQKVIPGINNNCDQAMTLSIEKLNSKGYSKIGYVSVDYNYIENLGAKKSFYYDCLVKKITHPPCFKISPHVPQEISVSKTFAWMTSLKLDAVIFQGSEWLIKALHKKSKSASKKIGLISLDILENNSVVSGCVANRQKLGQEAMLEIHKQLSHRTLASHHNPLISLVSPIWNEGSTY